VTTPRQDHEPSTKAKTDSSPTLELKESINKANTKPRRLQLKDKLTLAISLLSLLVASGTGYIGYNSYRDQSDLIRRQAEQIDALERTTPTGSIRPFVVNGTLAHDAPPMDVSWTSRNVPDNGDLWVFNHKPLDRDNGRPDAYYPTEVEVSKNGSWVAHLVYVGTPQDHLDVTYRVSLYYCSSADSLSIQDLLRSPEKRQKGLPAINGPSCKELDSLYVKRLGAK
jgi:hypothetical protein